MDNELLVKSVRELCKTHNISPSKLENELNFGAGLISRWIKSSPSIDKIIDIADYFHVSLDEVVGRNLIEEKEDKLIISLMQMTLNKEIEWEFVSNPEEATINNKSYEELFFLFQGEEIEVYKSKFDQSVIFFIVQYDIEQGVMRNLSIEVYIQPDKASTPVCQDINLKETIELWMRIREPFKRIPDEWKADTVREKIINKNNLYIKIVDCDTSKKVDNKSSIEFVKLIEQSRNVLEQLNTKEIQSAIKFLNSKEFKSIKENIQKELNTSLNE